MRGPLIALAGALLCTPAAAQPAPHSAQAAYVERAGLLELDARCGLLRPHVRAALRASANQARNALAAGGWSRAELDALQDATREAARARPCADARNASAVSAAEASYAAWARMTTMTFPGVERSWSASRIPDRAGWMLRQEAPGATLGIREHDGVPRLALHIELTADAPAPAAAEFLARDPEQAAPPRPVPGRVATGLELGRPAPATAHRFWASARSAAAASTITFYFPDAAFEAMEALSPREAVEIRIDGPFSQRAFLFEAGDVAAARAFLALQAR